MTLVEITIAFRRCIALMRAKTERRREIILLMKIRRMTGWVC